MPCTTALAGGNRKDSCVFERNRKHKERESGGPTGMPVKTVTCGVSTTISAALRLLFTFFLLSSHFISFPVTLSCLFILPLSSTCTLLYHSYFIAVTLSLFFFFFFSFFLQCFGLFIKILGCIFSDIMHLPLLPVFILAHQTVMGQ